MAKQALTVKQQRFVDLYDGNGVQAARAAGYKGNDNTLAVVAKENLRKPHLKAAIEAREQKAKEKGILTREERQRFWSDVIRGEERERITVDGEEVEVAPSMQSRLKASELLGRSQADFTDNVNNTGRPLVIVKDFTGAQE
ncbi:MAG: terminase small subunit [Desulfobulbaceae bacterium]|nr:terminase small subunit [Desulfobulbaceae bacterium]